MIEQNNPLKTEIESGKVLGLDDVDKAFNYYNFIININGDCIDTTLYKQHKFFTNQHIDGAVKDNEAYMVLTSSTNPDFANQSILKEENEKRVIIFENTVESILIKSKRNFKR